MPDITACVNASCVERKSCYRFRCLWTPLWQSVSVFSSDPGECLFFTAIEGRPVVSEEEAEFRAQNELEEGDQ